MRTWAFARQERQVVGFKQRTAMVCFIVKEHCPLQVSRRKILVELKRGLSFGDAVVDAGLNLTLPVLQERVKPML